jgi:hypothetical protein
MGVLDFAAHRGYVAVSAAATQLPDPLVAVYVSVAGTMTFTDIAGSSFTVNLVAGTYFYGPFRAITALGGGAVVIGVRSQRNDAVA